MKVLVEIWRRTPVIIIPNPRQKLQPKSTNSLLSNERNSSVRINENAKSFNNNDARKKGKSIESSKFAPDEKRNLWKKEMVGLNIWRAQYIVISQRGRYDGLFLPPLGKTQSSRGGGWKRNHHISRVANLLIAPTGEFSHTLKRQGLQR